MTWRRFLVLLGGLSVQSRWAIAIATNKKKGKSFATQAEAEACARSGYGFNTGR